MKKILIVEDEEVLIKVFCEKFERENYEVRFVVSGDLVLSIAKEFTPHIILLDVFLPNKSGLEVLAELKSDETTKNISVIIMSNFDGEERVKEALSLGAIDYLVKSEHSIRKIVEKVNSVVGNF